MSLEEHHAPHITKLVLDPDIKEAWLSSKTILALAPTWWNTLPDPIRSLQNRLACNEDIFHLCFKTVMSIIAGAFLTWIYIPQGSFSPHLW